MKYVVNLTLGPSWKPGVPIRKQGPSMGEHLETMRKLYEAGVVELGGPFEDESGGIVIFEAETIEQVTAAMCVDPAVVAGVLGFDVKRLHAVFDRLHGVAAVIRDL
jgi:uncharacterized protein YciI